LLARSKCLEGLKQEDTWFVHDIWQADELLYSYFIGGSVTGMAKRRLVVDWQAADMNRGIISQSPSFIESSVSDS